MRLLTFLSALDMMEELQQPAPVQHHKEAGYIDVRPRENLIKIT